MKKIALIYPPGEMYQRGEDRCQINVNASVSNSMRSCNDLGYCAAILKDTYHIFLKDYQSEKLLLCDLLNDFSREKPDIVLISTTNGSIFDDLEIIKAVKKINKDVTILLKGALFFNPDKKLFEMVNLSDIDYLIGGEIEFIIKPLLEVHFNNKSLLADIEGISYKKNGDWISNFVTHFHDKLDEIPFPDRSLINNSLYINPLTNKKMATITASRGCPYSCIYCISPYISGKNVRFRSPINVFRELLECFEKYDISDFFFKSDTFTINKEWVLELCELIINSKLCDKINWSANSRVNTIDEEMIVSMKKAGCSLIALGIESGSSESLLRMKKGITLEQIHSTVKLIKKYDIMIFAFFLIGFEWENRNHLNQTRKLIFELNPDFIEISVVVPFMNSEIYNSKINILGKDSYKNILSSSSYLSKEEIEKFRKNVIFSYHFRFSYIMKKLFLKKISWDLFKNYVKYAIRILKNK